jgi:glycosyltransferase involved in cell wall biosynthesis
MRKCLFVSYVFPPVGGAGVQRPAKFVKYLEAHGWKPVVLTVSNPSVPAFDHSLAEEIPKTVEVATARTLEPTYAAKKVLTDAHDGGPSQRVIGILRRIAGSLLVPDPQALWIPLALLKGLRLIHARRLEVIIVTGPPFSSFVLGALLSRLSGRPLLLDYRDEWTISSKYWENRAGGTRLFDPERMLERWVLRSAAAVIATTAASARALLGAVEQAGSTALVDHIYNGFDPSDLRRPSSGEGKDRDPEVFQLLYAGTLWNLTSAEPIVRALEALANSSADARQRLEFLVVGRVTPPQAVWLNRLTAVGFRVVRRDYLDHDAAVQAMYGADALCVLLSGVPGAERVVPAKIFEYMAVEKPILAVMPDGEAAQLLKDIGGVQSIRPDDVDRLTAWFQNAIQQRPPTPDAQVVRGKLRAYQRDVQAGMLASLLDRVVAAKTPLSATSEGADDARAA